MSHVAERPDVQTLDNFIGGRWVKAQTTEFFDVHNPAVGDVIGRTPLSTGADVGAAVDAAKAAFPAWRETPVVERARIFFRYRQLVEENFDRVCVCISREAQSLGRSLNDMVCAGTSFGTAYSTMA